MGLNESESANTKVIKWLQYEVKPPLDFTGDFYFTAGQLLDNEAIVSFSSPTTPNPTNPH